MWSSLSRAPSIKHRVDWRVVRAVLRSRCNPCPLSFSLFGGAAVGTLTVLSLLPPVMRTGICLFVFVCVSVSRSVCPFSRRYVPESVLKKRKAQDELRQQRQADRATAKKEYRKKRGDIFKRAEKYVAEYRKVCCIFPFSSLAARITLCRFIPLPSDVFLVPWDRWSGLW